MRQFLTRFRNYREQQTCNRLSGFVAAFGRVKERLSEFREQARQRERLVAPRFNVFHILRVSRKEDDAHTPMLAELLNPCGGHGQGTLFLRGFLKVAASRGLQAPPAGVEDQVWEVETERYIGNGFLDIAVSCELSGYLMVIENKIDAGEQPHQLSRYKEWMRSQSKHLPTQELVFLTPTGREAITGRGCNYLQLSYSEDVRAWLNAALPNVKAPKVAETLRQYLEIIDTL